MAEAVPAAPADAGTPGESFPEFDADPTPASSPSKEAAAPAPGDAPSKAPDESKDGEKPKDAPPDPADAKPKPDADKEAGADDAPPAEPEPGPFKFMGKTFKDAEAAEKYLDRSRKSAEGRQRAEAKRQLDAEAKARADVEARLTEAVRAANYYKTESEKAARSPEKPAEAAKAPEKSWIEDQKLWDDVRKLAQDEGVDAAMYYALQKAQGHMTKEYDEKLKAAVAPYQRQAQAEKVKDYTNALFQAAEDFMEADGVTPVYPELRESAETNNAIARIWASLDPNFALTEPGVDYAILRFRAERGGKPPSKAPAPSGASEVVRKATDEKNKPAEDLNGGGVPRQIDDSDPRAKFKRDFAGTAKPVLAAGGESLGFME